MFNKEALKKELSVKKSESFIGSKVSSIFILKRIYYLSHLVNKCEKNEEDYKNNCYIYLADNYSRLEESLKDAAHKMFRLKRISTSGFTSRYLKIFCRYIQGNSLPCNTEELKEFFETVNANDDYPGLCDTVNMLMYYRSAVILAIFDVFEKILKEDAGKEDEQRLEELFLSYEAVQNFDEKEYISTHPAEKILCNDPAGIYIKLSENTKSSYRRNLEKTACQKKTDVVNMAHHIVDKCLQESEYTKRHIGYYLCDKPVFGNAYMVLLVFMTILFTLLLCFVNVVFVLSVFAVFTCTRLLLDKIILKFAKEFTLPEIELSEIPDGNGVIVVITSLLTGQNNDKELFSKLEMLYFLARGKNVTFGLLCDLCDSDYEFDENDRKTLENANKAVLLLRKKYGEHFYLFLRQRQYSKSEEKYTAPERKRGAVMSLCSFLCENGDDFAEYSIKPSDEQCRNIKYVFTLDADTNLEFDCLKKAVGIMMHPQNIPVYSEEKNAVVGGYGIIQPCVSTTPRDCNRNFFTSVLCGHGGVSSYETGIVDGAMTLFGKSIFVGKGMFEKNVFYKALCADNSFRDEYILSHDSPEGARLRCAYVKNITLTDSFPSNELSYYKRLHRWVRGDIQNIPFLLKNVRTKKNKKIKNGIGIASRLFVFENIKNAFLPVFTVLCIFASLGLDKKTQILLVTVSFSPYILPFVYSFLSTLRKTALHNYKRLFFSNGIYSGIFCDFFLCVFKIFALVKTACVNLDAIFRSFCRMYISKKHLLEWTTSAQNDSEKNDGLLGYVKKNILSAIFGVILYVKADNSFLKLVGLAWFFMPYFAYVFSKETKKEIPVSKEEREKLEKYGYDMWQFFEEYVVQKTNFLPPDNVSFKVGEKICKMTSPTNIGLYLVSICVSAKLGYISTDRACTKLKETLLKVKKLPKYKGLLYNWYDVYKCKAMNPKYVSSVDIGNYLACLYTVKGAILEFEQTDKIKEIEPVLSSLINECDLGLLYNKKRQLFYIGFTDTEKGCVYDKNFYDMLVSEARILSFVACSQRIVDANHYKKLSRRFVEGDGYLGLASWSGTVFEYFMPELFFASEKSTLLYEALCFALHFSKKTITNKDDGGVYGISESCYNVIDSDGNYKYKAFGVENLAIDVYDTKLVISAYSSFLTLGFEKYDALKNLENIKALGGYGKYGFYESVDFENRGGNGAAGVVKCFMSHHVGMSILGIANRVLDGCVNKWFLNDKNNLAFLSYTKEQIPYNAYIKKNAKRHYALFGKIKKANESTTKQMSASQVTLLCDMLKLDASKEGMRIFYNNLEVFRNGADSKCIFAGVCISDKKFDCINGAQMILTDNCISFEKYLTKANGERYKSLLCITLDKNTADIIRMRLTVRPLFEKARGKIKGVFCFTPHLEISEDTQCSLFDVKRVKDMSVCEKNSLKYRNEKSGLCMFCTLLTEKNNNLSVKPDVMGNNTGVLEVVHNNVNGKFECELVLSLSDNPKCAEMGAVRSKERDFDTCCKILSEQKNIGKTKKISDVMAACVIKEDLKNDYPINTQNGKYNLLCGKNFASVVSNNGLGFSFYKDAKSGQVSRYSEKYSDLAASEFVFFGKKNEFDLAKNANKTEIFPYMVQYTGSYCADSYKMTAFVCAAMPFKVVVVETCSQSSVCFCVNLPQNLCQKSKICGGLVYLSDESRNGFCSFVTGICFENFEATRQAELLTENESVYAYFDFEKQNKDSIKRYVFVIGKADSIDKAYLYQTSAFGGYEDILKGSVRFAEKLYIDTQSIPSRLYQLLLQGFVMPDNKYLLRAFVNTPYPVAQFDTLLLIYTKSELKAERILSGFMKKTGSLLSQLLLYLSLCEYHRLNEASVICEKKIDKEFVYRICAVRMIEMAKDVKVTKDDYLKKMYLYTLDRIMSLCRNLQDDAAFYRLNEIKKTIL